MTSITDQASEQFTQDALSSDMHHDVGQILSSTPWLKTRMTFAIVIGSMAVSFFVWILFRLETQNVNYRAQLLEEELGDEPDMQLEVEDDDENNNNNNNHNHSHATSYTFTEDGSTSPTATTTSGSSSMDGPRMDNHPLPPFYKRGDTHGRPRTLPFSQKVTILLQVSVLLLLEYLLLVFLPSSVILSFVAVTAIWMLTLSQYLRNEIRQWRRSDRILTLIALFFCIAGCMSLFEFCRLALREGEIYEGPARIVGYDTSAYNNHDGQTLRTDVIVAWGGAWACPETPTQTCQSFVQGTLCETDYDPSDDQIFGTRRLHNGNNKRRILKQQKNNNNSTHSNNSSTSSSSSTTTSSSSKNGGSGNHTTSSATHNTTTTTATSQNSTNTTTTTAAAQETKKGSNNNKNSKNTATTQAPQEEVEEEAQEKEQEYEEGTLFDVRHRYLLAFGMGRVNF
jgi:hypothetical protein